MADLPFWDVIVVGGGPGGCLTAATLARAGHRVLLVEADTIGRRRIAEVLAPDVVRQLSSWMSWHSIGSDVVKCCRGVMTRWGFAEQKFTDYELLTCGPAWIVVRPAFDRLLMARAEAAGAEVRLGWRCAGVCQRAPGFEVAFGTRDGRQMARARAVVNASGRSGGWSDRRRKYHDGQLAYAAICGTPAELFNCLWVESARDGWWYLVPLPSGGTQVVWITERRPDSRVGNDKSTLLKRAFESTQIVRSAFTIEPVFDSTFMADARLSTMTNSWSTGVLSVGDAVATSDPLSGRGWAYALKSALAAAEMVHEYLRLGQRPRSLCHEAEVLRGVERHLSQRTSYWAAMSPSRG